MSLSEIIDRKGSLATQVQAVSILPGLCVLAGPRVYFSVKFKSSARVIRAAHARAAHKAGRNCLNVN